MSVLVIFIRAYDAWNDDQFLFSYADGTLD